MFKKYYGKKVVKTKEISYQEYLDIAEKYINKNKINEAKNALNNAIKNDKTKEDAYIRLSEVEISQDKGDEALNVLVKAKNSVSESEFEHMSLIEETAYYNCYRNIINDFKKIWCRWL